MSSLCSSRSSALMGARGPSLFQSLARRQICPLEVRFEYPFAGDWTSERTYPRIRTTVEIIPPLALSFAKELRHGHLLAVADDEGCVDY